ncbi:BlaR1 peptidase M56 [Reichenbachiella agariperforans]|uniref:BlaR1 peptidase M56 n=1 Tax=Reichenbachiella agariperforans TaxID=156994 RepID=A0A1M6N750_REIAG|nr:M56 family metallopeptidase [Reichenbachiella agariperforans]SHJ91548.1 BlaR1 peptidase M56 [Reichenbachiella agariperforans]
MDRFLIYLLESSLILVGFYLLYHLVLRPETFFSLNRFYLITILLVSLIFPLLSFDFGTDELPAVKAPILEVSQARKAYYDAFELWSFDHLSGNVVSEVTSVSIWSGINWWQLSQQVFVVIYLIGVVVCLSRTFWTFRWVFGLIRQYPLQKMDDLTLVKVAYPIAPFSFLKFVFVHEVMIGSTEFDQILAHERTHVHQRHSIDLIIVQLLAAFLWFNPVIWQLIKSLKTTHEYIADNKIMNAGYSLVEYQSLLLRQLISNNSYGLVHNFNLSFIKKRITMMKNQKSGWSGKVKVALAIASTIVFSVLIVQCNSTMDETSIIENESSVASIEAKGVNLPILPDVPFYSYLPSEDAVEITIVEDKITLDDEDVQVVDMALSVAEKITEQGIIILSVDAQQPMKLVRDVQTELRRANRRKVLYLGQTTTGKIMESAMLLPPLPGAPNEHGVKLPEIDAAYIAKHDLHILRVEMGEDRGVTVQQEVYDFVTSEVAEERSNYVVQAKFQDEDSYKSYLQNLAYIQEGFNQIYQERTQSMFGKNFMDLNKEVPEEKEQYNAVRKGIPRAISISEK